MKVTLINSEESSKLFERWGEFARVCYNSPKGKETFIGKHCYENKHYSGSRTTYFIFHISGVSRALTAQLNRHSIGMVVNEKSMRYVDFSEAEVTIPPSINKIEDAKVIFNECVSNTQHAYKALQTALKEHTDMSSEEINQDARYICNIGIQTEGMWAFDLEALENFMEKRLCLRAQWEIRELATKIKLALSETVDKTVYESFNPVCMKYNFCPENKQQCKHFKKTVLTYNEFQELSKTDSWKKIIKEIKKV